MNKLVIGLNKEALLERLPDRFLLIDDGAMIDALPPLERKSVHEFNIATDCFNPLKDMSYRKAREFWDVLKAVFPEGEDTLTKAAAEYQILSALLDNPKKLSRLIPKTKDTLYAHQMIAKLLLSPVLSDVLTRPTNMSFKHSIIARLDRAALGDFDCFVLGNLLISQFQGAIVIPDFGFYGHKGHMALLRQNRLIAGIHAFDEVPELRQQLLLIEDKTGSRCTPEDAELLAIYEGLAPGTVGHSAFIARSIGA